MEEEYLVEFTCKTRPIYETVVKSHTGHGAVAKADREFDIWRNDPNTRYNRMYSGYGEDIDVWVSLRQQK
jgi:hypothetical protein